MSYSTCINSDNAIRCEATNMDANEVLRRYANGERNFREADWRGISLTNANLSGIDLSGAHLSNADLSDSDLSNANLNWAGLKGTNFSRANLRGAKMPDGRKHNDLLESANYFSS
ncbi:pentapeptide repeat-containing protein [Nostoc cycadae]|nr:pentapeptide repeat-containing protein [Nostoc cycadae]